MAKLTVARSFGLVDALLRVGIVGLALVGFLIFCTGALLVGVGLLAALPLCSLLLHAAFHDIRAQEA